MFDKVKETIELYRVEKKLINILSISFLVSLLFNLVLIVSIISLFPLKEKVPYLVHFQGGNTAFAQVKKADDDLTSDKILRESLAVTYVVNKETKNNIDDLKRQEIVRHQSNVKVWNQHKLIVSHKDSIYQRKDLTRAIDVVNVQIFPNTNIAQVYFRAKVFDEDRLIQESDFRAVLKFTFTEEKIKLADVDKNPYSYKVIEYGLSKIKDIETKKEQ